MKRAKIPKDVQIMALGAATGVILPVALTQYVDTTQPPLWPEGGAWGKYGTLIPIAAGGLALVLAVFTNVVKKPNSRRFLGMFGVTSLTSGFLTALFSVPIGGFRAPARAMARPTVRRNAAYYGTPAGGISVTGITGQTVYA